MAMPSLLPSPSVETISEWANDGSRKSTHNRSISEPDFGRSPKQNPSQDGGSVDAQSKSSGPPSRFGRIGSTLFQKTIGWVSRSRQAKLGESNKFYYDEKLKRWVEEGAEPPAEELALPPPPTTTVLQNGISDYNSAFKYQCSTGNGGSEAKPSGIPPISAEANLRTPPIPPSQNQFSAHGRGVWSRYVDTFNKGGTGGSGGALTNSFQSLTTPSVKPAIGAKFFVPMAPAPSDEQKSDSIGESIPEPTSSSEPSTSVSKEGTLSSPPSALSSSPSPSSLQRFPSMDNITPTRSSNGPFSCTRAASWSGIYPEANSHKLAGQFGGLPPTFLPQDPPSTRSSSSSSLQLNGGELLDVEL